jgi:hypothetical protein
VVLVYVLPTQRDTTLELVERRWAETISQESVTSVIPAGRGQRAKSQAKNDGDVHVEICLREAIPRENSLTDRWLLITREDQQWRRC